VATYRQTVLTAFQQVEDALVATRNYSQQILRQQEAVRSSQQFFDLEMQRYQSGIDPFVNVLTAQNTLLGDQLTLNTLQVQQMMSAVQLVQALGGGWDRSQLPTPSQVTHTTKTDYKMER
jgi:outer membrane protein TolC